MPNIACEYCGSYEHYKTWCYNKPKQPIKVKVTEVKKRGKHFYAWKAFRKDWLSRNPELVFTCGICGGQVSREEVTLDHIIPRSSGPQFRYDPKNIQPAHYLCNTTKGSRKVDITWS